MAMGRELNDDAVVRQRLPILSCAHPVSCTMNRLR
jgi:hypothetical protein